jgi:hypothetical protein
MDRRSSASSIGPEEPQVEQGEEQPADGELEPDGGLRGREEAFEAAGDDQHGNDAGDQARGFDAAAGDRLLPAQAPGKSMAWPRRKPAAPAMMMEGSSSEPCGATKLHSAPTCRTGGRPRDDAEHHAVYEEERKFPARRRCRRRR